MIFSSYPFVLFFLPSVLLAVWLIRRLGQEWIVALLNVASLAFYAWWEWRSLWIIFLSIGVNFLIGRLMTARRVSAQKYWLVAGIAFNLVLLGYFKYSNFFISNLNAVAGAGFSFVDIVLPLGISFFSFTQIAYLVDAFRGESVEHDFRHYLLFVVFFPHLIAGPIVHHKQLMPQLVGRDAGRLSAKLLAPGVAIFVAGIAKKLLIADPIGRQATPVFDAAASGAAVPFIESWCGVLSYTLQIYFDFSAYSDMAVGLALMFGVRFPVNFRSPYKAESLIEFWRRWHISLSGFLRHYLYIPLGGNRCSALRRNLNVMVVMLLGGFWHGASWNFVVWGGMHGVGIVLNQLWRDWRNKKSGGISKGSIAARWMARLITFLFVMLAWVFFRSPDLASAGNILSGMAGLNGVVLPPTYGEYFGAYAHVLRDFGWRFEVGYLFLGVKQLAVLVLLLGVVWGLPNVMDWARYQENPQQSQDFSVCPHWILWRPNAAWAILLSFVAIVSLYFMSRTGEFLYFQF